MPEPTLDVRDATIRVEWEGTSYAGIGRLRLTEHEVLVEVSGTERMVRAPYASIRGADLRSGALTLYAVLGHVAIDRAASGGLDRAWVTLQQRACTLPEFTVGLRALGSRHGGDAALQGRFFAPLLAARRRLEEQSDLHWRLAAFDAAELRERTIGVLRDIVSELAATSPAFRRALVAQALDEADGFQRALDALGEAADALRGADDAERFEAWRAWASRARAVFAEADRCWLSVRPMLERASHGAAPRRGRGGALALVAMAACLSAT